MPKRKHNPDLPTAKEISPAYGTNHEDLDSAHAMECFYGKTLEQAELLFRQNALHHQEDLKWMGPVGFRFYVQSFTRYLESSHSAGDSDAANCFASLLKYLLDEGPKTVAPVADQLAKTCQHILQHYEKFEINPDIYGDLRPDYEVVIARLNKLQEN